MKKRLLALLLVASALYGEEPEVNLSEIEEPLYYGEGKGGFVIRWAYQDFCDFVYDPRIDIWRWPTDKKNGVTFDPEEVTPGSIIFVRNIPRFFEKMHPEIKHPYIILTAGECLDQMQESFEEYLNEPNVIAWFGIHPCEMTHPKYHPIPIGIVQEPDNYKQKKKLAKYFEKLRKTTPKGGRDSLVYMNFADAGKPERQKIREKFTDKPYIRRGKRQPFHGYLHEMAQCKFAFSPHGLGPDCYRTWESLLVGTIPVLRHSQLDPMFENLPVLLINSWDEVTEEFLDQKYKEITAKKYDIAPLFMDFWIHKIRAVQKAFKEGRK